MEALKFIKLWFIDLFIKNCRGGTRVWTLDRPSPTWGGNRNQDKLQPNGPLAKGLYGDPWDGQVYFLEPALCVNSDQGTYKLYLVT